MEQGWRDANRRWWDERVPIHLTSAMYAHGQIFDWIVDEVGPLDGLDVVHLQCHFGNDTLALLDLGARQVTGLDFSPPAVEAARARAAERGLADRSAFVCADVDDAPAALGRTFDLVFTGIGALAWLPSVARWARVVAALLRPGGRLYLAELHPILETLDDDGTVRFPYLEGEPVRWDEPGTYADRNAKTEHNVQYVFPHGLGEIVTALIDAGLRIDYLHERTQIFYPAVDSLVEVGPGRWAWPQGEVPLLFSLSASAT